MKLICGILFLILLIVITARISEASVEMSCVPLTWNQAMICEWPAGTYTHYTTGNIVLAGNVPQDNSWDNHLYQLSGYLVKNGSCTMLFVTKSYLCSTE
jgi:hypothetical protein